MVSALECFPYTWADTISFEVSIDPVVLNVPSVPKNRRTSADITRNSASDYDGRGYLNMQLTEEEWHQMLTVDGQSVHFGRPGCLQTQDGSVPPGFEEGQVFAPSMDRSSPLWVAISDGLKLFGFKESEVINIVRIPIVVQAVEEGVQKLPAVDSTAIKRPHGLVAVAGDAAMTVHFWPGRGLNSGIKVCIARLWHLATAR